MITAFAMQSVKLFVIFEVMAADIVSLLRFITIRNSATMGSSNIHIAGKAPGIDAGMELMLIIIVFLSGGGFYGYRRAKNLREQEGHFSVPGA